LFPRIDILILLATLAWEIISYRSVVATGERINNLDGAIPQTVGGRNSGPGLFGCHAVLAEV
jgi:hypothetical protein